MTPEVRGQTWPPGTEVDPEAGAGHPEGEQEEAPVGTLLFMVAFLLVMAGLWLAVFWMLIER